MFPAGTLALLLAFAGEAEAGGGSEADKVEAWIELCTAHAVDYEIYPADKPEEKFRLLPHPVFRHSAPSRGGDDIGAVYLWVREDGRPAAVGTIFTWLAGEGYRNATHEFHSLSEEPIIGVWRNRDRWSPSEAGVEWQAFADAAVPAESAVLRLRQMRGLARRFSAHTVDQARGRWELRLIPTPLYHYEIPIGGTLCGALFAICQDTNTDVILCIEARRTNKDYRWHYACGSFADWELHVQLDEVEVWSDPSSRQVSRGPSNVHWVRKIRRVKLPEGE